MIKKQLVSGAIFAALVFGNFSVVFAANSKPSFLAGLWSSFRGRVSLMIRTIYAPFYSPPVQVQAPRTDGNAIQAVNTGQNVQGLTIPGKFGFDGKTPVPGTVPSTEKPKSAPVLKKIDTVVGPGAAFKPIPIAPAPKPALIKPPVAPTPVAPLPVPSASQVKVLELVVTAVSNLIAAPVKEGSQIQFLANLKLSNGTFKDVTKLVKWSVLGDIGSINAGGIFSALLGMSVSEMGEGVGSVIATYAGPEGVFLGKSAIFKVYAAAGMDGDIGGQ